jgi:hypothetical protein
VAKKRKKAQRSVPTPVSPAFLKRAAKQKKRDEAYRAALGITEEEPLPRDVGVTTGHGGAQPQVGSRRRGAKVLRGRLGGKFGSPSS